MNPLVLYLLLLEATLTSFSGLTSLPLVRHHLVETRRVLTDRQLNAAVAAGRTCPGPNGLYLTSVGYFVAGVPGACAGTLAVATPAFLIIPLLRYIGRRADSRRVRGAIDAVTVAAAALVADATIPLARDAMTGWLPAAIAIGAFVLLIAARLGTFRVMLAAAAVGLTAAFLR
jgi:chromate transporter